MLRIVCGQWHYRFQIHGVEYTGSTHVDASGATGRKPTPDWSAKALHNYQRAQQTEAQKKALVFSGREDELKIRTIPFGVASTQFLEWCESEYEHKSSARRIFGSFTSLLEFFGPKTPVYAIRAGRLEDFKAWRRRCPECGGRKPEVHDCECCEATGEGVQSVTIRHDLHAASVFFQYAKKQGWCTSNPVRDVDIPSDQDAVRFHPITEQMERVYFSKCIQLAEFDLHDMGRLMILQGPRPGEVLSARAVDIDLERGTWRIPKSKSKAGERTLSLTAEARSILAARINRYGNAPGSGWIFPSPRAAGAHRTPLNDEHDAVLNKLAIEPFVIYDLRHAFATRLAESGADIGTVAKILGHANLRSVMRYVHISQKHAEEAMRHYEQSLVNKGQTADTPLRSIIQ